MPEPTLAESIVWRYRRWRAAHWWWAAWVDYERNRTLANEQRLDRADDLCRQLEDNRP